jgi:hypothetical protein
MLTGHEPAIHEALVKQIGEFSLPPKAGTNLMLFPLEEIRCSYPGPTVGGTPGLPCNRPVACEYLRVIVDNGVCTTPNNNLGIHVNIGPSQKEMCNHFICIQCLPHWHENVIGKLHHSLGSSPGSKTPVHCFVPSCDCIVGDPLTLEDTMRSLGCKFIVSVEYSKSPMKHSISTMGAAAKEASKHEELPANSVRIIAHASIDPEWIVAWASEVSDFNFDVRSTLTSVCEGIQLRDPDTEEWTDSIPSTDRTFCTTVVTFADAPLAQKFNDMFNLEAILLLGSGRRLPHILWCHPR